MAGLSFLALQALDPAPTQEATQPNPLRSVRTFMYQLRGLEDAAAVEKLTSSSYDLLVADVQVSSSVRSAMFIETRPPILPPKLRRSGMRKVGDQQRTGTDPADHQRTCRSYGAWACFRLQRTINMALLTELFHVGRPERLIA